MISCATYFFWGGALGCGGQKRREIYKFVVCLDSPTAPKGVFWMFFTKKKSPVTSGEQFEKNLRENATNATAAVRNYRDLLGFSIRNP